MDSIITYAIGNIIFTAALLFFAAKILSISLSFLHASIVALVGELLAAFTSGITGGVLMVFTYFLLLHIFTKSSFIGIFSLSIVSTVLGMAFAQFVITPFLRQL
ncbi:hypothetical protein [Parendozoicomonas haliclonae]|uniref:Uncharacterized protein n=1 Tax=Parendozoicomonas haliclonae TaxID=1960125 RepID=A0A1X7AS28_9GAMM|nr:hypothetical protein [Parendozoicomonas haliclonae]SMA50943.1 hypothetical protein EHSB41UT_04761 [Parendozoicomonas haliclonae]